MRHSVFLTVLTLAIGLFVLAPLTKAPFGNGVAWGTEKDDDKEDRPVAKPMTPEEKALRKRIALAQKKTFAAKYTQATSRRIRDLQTKLRNSFVNFDLQDMVFNPKSKKGDPPEKRFKSLYDFMSEYRALEAAAKTQKQKLDLAKLWDQLNRYSKTLKYRTASRVANGLQRSFEVDNLRRQALDAKAKMDAQTDTGKRFVASLDWKDKRKRFMRARAKLPKPMQAAFPVIK